MTSGSRFTPITHTTVSFRDTFHPSTWTVCLCCLLSTDRPQRWLHQWNWTPVHEFRLWDWGRGMYVQFIIYFFSLNLWKVNLHLLDVSRGRAQTGRFLHTPAFRNIKSLVIVFFFTIRPTVGLPTEVGPVCVQISEVKFLYINCKQHYSLQAGFTLSYRNPQQSQ